MSKTDEPNHNLEMQKSLIYAGVKASSVVVGYPMDVIRTRIYTNNSLDMSSATKGIYQSEGVRGFYKRGFASSMVKMGVKEGYRGFGYEHFGHGVGSVLFNATLDTLNMPLDKIKVVQQSSKSQKSFQNAAQEIYGNMGAGGFYRGAHFLFSRQVAAYSLTIGAQKILDDTLDKSFEGKPPLWAGVSGAITAGWAVSTVMNPVYKVSTRMHADTSGKSSITKVAKDMVTKEGAKGLLKGSSINLAFGIMGQVCYKVSKELCERLEERECHEGDFSKKIIAQRQDVGKGMSK